MSGAERKPTGNGYAWTEAELARAKALRREGYTHGTIAGLLREEFGTERTGQGVQSLWQTLRQRGEVVETVADHDRAAVRERRAELAAANTVRRRCLRCGDGFDSWGAGNRLCGECRRPDRSPE